VQVAHGDQIDAFRALLCMADDFYGGPDDQPQGVAAAPDEQYQSRIFQVAIRAARPNMVVSIRHRVSRAMRRCAVLAWWWVVERFAFHPLLERSGRLWWWMCEMDHIPPPTPPPPGFDLAASAAGEVAHGIGCGSGAL